MRLDQVPGVKVSKSGFVTFKVSDKRNPNQNQAFQHGGHVDIRDFARVSYWINYKEAKIKVSEKKVEIISGRDYYTFEFD